MRNLNPGQIKDHQTNFKFNLLYQCSSWVAKKVNFEAKLKSKMHTYIRKRICVFWIQIAIELRDSRFITMANQLLKYYQTSIHFEMLFRGFAQFCAYSINSAIMHYLLTATYFSVVTRFAFQKMHREDGWALKLMSDNGKKLVCHIIIS